MNIIVNWKRPLGLMVLTVVLIGTLFTAALISNAETAHASDISVTVKEVEAGAEIKFAERHWIVLDPEKGYIFSKHSTLPDIFGITNIFDPRQSYSLAQYLNGGYIPFKSADWAAIQLTEWSLYWAGIVEAKIGLISVDEWVHYYNEGILSYPQRTMWTITPDRLGNDDHVFVIEPDGTIRSSHVLDNSYVAHLALYLNLDYMIEEIINTEIAFTPSGDETWAKTHHTEVNLVNPHRVITRLDYNWSTSADVPARSDTGWKAFNDGDSIATPVGETGAYYLHVRGIDDIGKALVSAVSEVFMLDNVAPTVPVINGSQDEWTNAEDVSLTVTPGTDDESGVKETMLLIGPNDQAWSTYTEDSPITIQGEGKTSIQAKTIDHAENESPVATTLVKIDRRAPALAIDMNKIEDNTLYANDEWTNYTVHLSVYASDQAELSGLKELEIWQNGVKIPDVEGAHHQFVLEQDGVYNLIVKANDYAGNETTEQRTVKISRSGLQLERTLSQTDGTAYTNGDWTQENVTVSADVYHSQDVPVKAFQYSIDAGKTWTDYVAPLHYTEDGEHSLWTRVVDEALNELIDKITIKIDKTSLNIQFNPNGNDQALPQPTATTVVTVSDHCSSACSGVNTLSLSYVWSMDAEPLNEQSDWKTFQNDDELSHFGKDGEWYLHVRSEDLAGNHAYVISNPFHLDDPDQRNVQLNRVMLDEEVIPNFDPRITEYTVHVDSPTTKVTVTPITEIDDATIKLQVNHEGFHSVKSGQTSRTFDLREGQNMLEIEVTALNGITSRTYTIIIVRAAAEDSNVGRRHFFPPLNDAVEKSISPPLNDEDDGTNFPPLNNDSDGRNSLPPSDRAPIPVTTGNKSFTDVDGHWAEWPINEAVERSLIHGYPDGTFKPNGPVTRAEFIVMLARLFQWEDAEDELVFNDATHIGNWAKKSIAQALKAGVIAGYPDGRFKPNTPVTRAEMVMMIARALDISPANQGMTGMTGFHDDAEIPEWAKAAVELTRQLGIVIGRGDNYFEPNDTASRAEVVVILLRIIEKINR